MDNTKQHYRQDGIIWQGSRVKTRGFKEVVISDWLQVSFLHHPTSSFVPIVSTMATRGCCQKTNVNVGRDKLLAHITCTAGIAVVFFFELFHLHPQFPLFTCEQLFSFSLSIAFSAKVHLNIK